jgi:signal transduction histidine kinase
MSPALLESEDFAEAIVETIREPLLILDASLRVRTANPAFYRTFDLRPEATIGALVYELDGGAADVPGLRHLLEELVIENREVMDFRIESEVGGTDRRIVIANARRIQVRGSETESILLALEDVTESERYRERLEGYALELKRSNEELEQFAYVASHDLQEPLRMVISYLKLVERRYRDRLDEDGVEFIDYAVDGAERMRRLINDLLAFSRAGRRELEPVPVDLGDAVRAAFRSLEVQARSVGARLEPAPDLPVVAADRDTLVRVLQNLFSNAIKYRDDEPPVIRVSAEPSGSEWSVAVEDDGIGIPENHRERVFEIFRQLRIKPDADGTGIGLAICRRLVEAQGGRIWAEEAEGGGARICFTLVGARGAGAVAEPALEAAEEEG